MLRGPRQAHRLWPVGHRFHRDTKRNGGIVLVSPAPSTRSEGLRGGVACRIVRPDEHTKPSWPAAHESAGRLSCILYCRPEQGGRAQGREDDHVRRHARLPCKYRSGIIKATRVCVGVLVPSASVSFRQLTYTCRGATCGLVHRMGVHHTCR